MNMPNLNIPRSRYGPKHPQDTTRMRAERPAAALGRSGACLIRMLKHIVMWNLRGDSPEDKARAARFVKQKFEGLRGRIPGMLHLEVGVDASQVDYACDVVLYSEFDSQQALDDYATHPEHLRVRNELGDLRITRHQVDYQAA